MWPDSYFLPFKKRKLEFLIRKAREILRLALARNGDYCCRFTDGICLAVRVRHPWATALIL